MAREDTPRVRGVMLVVLGVIILVLVIYFVIVLFKQGPSASTGAPSPVVATTSAHTTPAHAAPAHATGTTWRTTA